jgi:putative MATE family efflux protein
MAKNFGKDMTEGSIPRHLLSLAIPMLLANLLSTGYNIIDAIWIGRFVGSDAMGAVAVSLPVVFMFVGVAAGATMATSVLVSQFYGAQNFKMLAKTVNTSFALSIVMSIVSAAVGIITVEWILRALGTPETIFPLAVSYLRITFFSFPALYMTFLVTSILRGAGDTKTPLYFMAVGVFINAVLDPFLIIGIGPFPGLGLDGAAWASLIASTCGLSLGIIYLRRKGSALITGLNIFALDFYIAKLIVKIGFPSMIQQSALALGMATVTSLVNSFGAATTAAFGIAGRIDSVAFMPAQSLGLAVSAISGQNIGAGRYDRISAIFKWGMLITLSITVCMSILFVSIPGILLAPFTTDPEVIAIGSGYLRIVGPAITFFAVMFVSNGIINGAGHTLTTLIFTLIAVWGLRVPLAFVLSKNMGITGVWLAYTIGISVMMCTSLLWYRSGRWKKPVVKHDVNVVVDM